MPMLALRADVFTAARSMPFDHMNDEVVAVLLSTPLHMLRFIVGKAT